MQGFVIAERLKGISTCNYSGINSSGEMIANSIGYNTTSSLEEVDFYMPDSSPFPVTITFKKAGYYLTKTSESAIPSWSYQTVNSTVTIQGNFSNNFVFLLYYDDLQQH